MKTYINPKPAIQMTEAELVDLGIPREAIEKGELRFGISPYRSSNGAPVSIKGLVSSSTWENHKRSSATFYRMGSLFRCKPCGYDIEGRVKLNGKTFRGFTSCQLFELPNKRFVSVAIIHACKVNHETK